VYDFPKGLKISDSEEFKEEICNAFPESDEDGTLRSFNLDVQMKNRIIKEAKENKGQSICYLVVSHGHFVDQIGKIAKTGAKFTNDSYYGEERDKILQGVSRDQYDSPYFCSFSGGVAFTDNGNENDDVKYKQAFNGFSDHITPELRTKGVDP